MEILNLQKIILGGVLGQVSLRTKRTSFLAMNIFREWDIKRIDLCSILRLLRFLGLFHEEKNPVALKIFFSPFYFWLEHFNSRYLLFLAAPSPSYVKTTKMPARFFSSVAIWLQI